jgi:hypothetical protein
MVEILVPAAPDFTELSMQVERVGCVQRFVNKWW